MRLRATAWVLASALLGACSDAGSAAGSAPIDTGTAGDASSGGDAQRDGGGAGSGGTGGGAGDAGAGGAGSYAVPGLELDLPLGAPIDAAPGAWSFVAFPDARCANGSTTGIAINPVAAPEGLLVFMQGGGACWDEVTCLQLQASVHLSDVVDEGVVLAEASQLSGIFDHANPLNPFSRWAYVYMPYCTGDLHAGTRANTYAGDGGPVTLQHVGARNVEAYLKRLVPTFAEVPRVVVAGISAGGFGATLNWWRYQAAFPDARVDVLDDAGLLVDAPDDRYLTMVDVWGMSLPAGCDDCAERMSAWLPFYATRMTAPRRYGLLAFLGDAVIGQYFGLDASAIERQLLSLREGAADNQKTFYLPGTQHSVIGEGSLSTTSDGETLLGWTLQFHADAASWDHAGP